MLRGTHAHVDAAAEVAVFVHEIAVAVLLRRPRARPDAPWRLRRDGNALHLRSWTGLCAGSESGTREGRSGDGGAFIHGLS